MARDIIGFLLIAIFLGLLFWWPQSDWRAWQKKYQFSRADRTAVSDEGIAGSKMETLDSTGLDSLYRLVTDSEFQVRLDRLADSLMALKLELAGYDWLLLSARQAARGVSLQDESNLSNIYFSAARSVAGIEKGANEIHEEVDSLRRELLLARWLKESGGSRQGESISRTRWLSPARVPVREACTSCHQQIGARRVMLKPDEDRKSYPKEMLEHPPGDFGCTVCHCGIGGELSFEKAHGPDNLGRPFRKGMLAFRSCGICHAKRFPMKYSKASFDWPESCQKCHEISRLALAADSSLFSSAWFTVDEFKVRSWLLRHWSKETGSIPPRESVEEVVAFLVSGSLDNADSGKAVHGDLKRQFGETKALRCPVCGRTFKFVGGLVDFVCPVDGSKLQPLVDN
ncbi:MAG TPA: cytochrome c3 family protein [archaeon]|nr:cytochrome c3 family protein [archaeon]